MATVEINEGRYVKRFEFWNPATWAIPKLYWDAFSQEQRIHAICRQLEKVIRYADYIGVNVDDIAQRLQDIEDGKLDEFIVSAIETWFEENEPEIMQAIENLQTAVQNTNNIIGEGFTTENTVKDAIDAANTAIGETNENLEKVDKDVQNITSNDFYIPEQMGILRIPTYQYNDLEETNNVRWGQGLCVYDNVAVQAVINPATAGDVRIYVKDLENDYFNSGFATETLYHASSIVYVPELDKYMISHGDSGIVSICDRELFTIEQTIDLGNSAILLGYDFTTGTLYGSDYGANLFTIDPVTFETENIEIWDSGFPSGAKPSLQDIDVEDGILYILYSEAGRIDRYDVATKRFVSSVNFPNKTNTCFIGETEGIFVNQDKEIFFSSVNHNNEMLAYDYTRIWKIDLNSPSTNTNWISNTGGRTITVSDATDENLRASQNPNGTGARPFPTIAEAFDFMLLNPQINTISISGDHSDEIMQIDLPQLTMQGTSATVAVGRISITNGKTALRNLVVTPKVSTVANFIQGYRNGLLCVDTSVTFADTPVPTSGHYLQTQGQLITTFGNTNWPS